MDIDTSAASGWQAMGLHSPEEPSQTRVQRGAIAAQACDTCRSRKQKCDEKRPACSTCQKFKLECRYREAPPTKKDKTLMEILDRLRSLEGKIDMLSSPGRVASHISGPTLAQAPTPPATGYAASTARPYLPSSMSESSSSSRGPPMYQYVSSVHEMLAWPMVHSLLGSVETPNPLVSLDRHGASIVLGLYQETEPLPVTTTGPPSITGMSALGSPLGSQEERRGSISATKVASIISWPTMHSLSKSYFETFNLMYPIVDRLTFTSTVLPAINDRGLDDSTYSALAYLVFALGEVAIAGVQGMPTDLKNVRQSGIKGGSKIQPPGLALFNEGRKRMGFALTECSLENVQISALAGIYYETCFHHMEFWRMTMSASLACAALITSKPSELSSPRADVIRRVFWHCSMVETYFNLELGLPLTGLTKYENMVKVPDFGGPYDQADYVANEYSCYQEHFASQIVLRRLSTDFSDVLSNVPCSSPALSSMTVTTPPVSQFPAFIAGLAQQLEHWRVTLLPVHLRWPESDPGAFPTKPDRQQQSMYQIPTPSFQPHTAMAAVGVSPSHSRPVATAAASSSAAEGSGSGSMFTTDLDSNPANYPYALDIQVAMLRARYYHTKCLVYRPFFFKVVQHPENLTQEDAEGAAKFLCACLRWPIAMSPTAKRKRLIPCLWFWTQNLLGILVVLHLSQKMDVLRQIRISFCGEKFESDAQQTVDLAVDWIRDVKGVDGAAAWAWGVVKVLYKLED